MRQWAETEVVSWKSSSATTSNDRDDSDNRDNSDNDDFMKILLPNDYGALFDKESRYSPREEFFNCRVARINPWCYAREASCTK